mmetsp:Transcript_29317/g.53472  ORF Transcript_29317/g.53472 Transcript_29317/m.53472 type:complete len:117 (-) Transcript_29317:696-1046(-)
MLGVLTPLFGRRLGVLAVWVRLLWTVVANKNGGCLGGGDELCAEPSAPPLTGCGEPLLVVDAELQQAATPPPACHAARPVKSVRCVLERLARPSGEGGTAIAATPACVRDPGECTM